MKEEKNRDNRRGFLKCLGMTALGLVAWPVFRRESSHANAGVFAGLFLQDTPRLQIPPGYYDPESQLYFDAQTRQPMFVAAQTKSGEKALSEKELSDLLGKDTFISSGDLKKHLESGIKTRGRATSCTLTSLRTTGCCPIITDRESDTISDD